MNVNAAEDECGDALALLRHYRETLLEGLQQKKFERGVSQVQAFSEVFRDKEWCECARESERDEE